MLKKWELKWYLFYTRDCAVSVTSEAVAAALKPGSLSVISRFPLMAAVRLMVNVPLSSHDLGIKFIPGMSLEVQYNSHFTQEEIESQMG